jgi:hypothetical protein
MLDITAYHDEQSEWRLRSAFEIDRVISHCGANLTSLCLDGLNLAKCPDTVKHILSTCTGLRALSLRDACLTPNSASMLTSLRSLESLFWDFGNPQLSKRMKSVASDFEVIRQLSRLTSLGVGGNSDLDQVFPGIYDILENTIDPPASILPLISTMEAKLPPKVGIRGFVFHSSRSTLLGLLCAFSHAPVLISEAIQHGAFVDSFALGHNLRCTSPITNLLHYHRDTKYKYVRKAREIFFMRSPDAESAERMMENLEILLRSGASILDLVPPFEIAASNIFTYAAQTCLPVIVNEYANTTPKRDRNLNLLIM